MNEHVDLTNCDREPIHQIGSIQSFGALVAVTSDWLIAHRSTNLAEFAGLEELPAMGEPLGQVFLDDAMRALREMAAELFEPDDVQRVFGLELVPGKKFDCALHASGQLTIIEFEPHEPGMGEKHLRMLQPVMSSFEGVGDVTTQCDLAVSKLKQMLGFDRVMIYRFQEDGSGDVVSEAREDHLESFLGLRYPHTDIPKQARALYLRNRFRIISDVDDISVPVEPVTTFDGNALDLSMSVLRAVSPIHLEYLRNMGVKASLSISIVVQGKLWGLFACHHYSPRVLPFSVRTAAELFSSLFSLVIQREIGRQHAAIQETGRSLHDQLMRAAVSGQSLVEALPNMRPVIERSLPHDGLSIYINGVYDSRGAAPSAEQFRAIASQLNAAAASQIISTDCITERIPGAAEFADIAAGALIIPVSRSPRDYLILWRRELKQVVTWAGNPVKSVEVGPNGDRLLPRKSFEAWQQSIEGKSADWTTTQRSVAENLRVTLLEIILRLTDDSMRERAKAQEKQELLIAELNHRVRNILNLIRGLISQSRRDAMSIEDFSNLIGGRIGALANAHDNITRENWSAAPFRQLIQSEVDAYLSGKTDRLTVTGDKVLIAPEAYTVLALVMHEMVTNSAKYGSLSDSTGSLRIDLQHDDSGLTINWKESGGPAVKAPERRGFGSTIIERSIPFELNGEAEVNYRFTGVEARFWVPGRFLQAVNDTDAANDGNAQPQPGNTLLPETLPKSVLLVEDSMIIALDAQDCLGELGVDRVDIEGTVSGALTQMRTHSYDMAMLDFNLGSETSEKVAEALCKHGIPFWLATGYGEMEGKVEKFGAQGMLVKPYGRDDLKRILEAFGQLD